MRAIIIASLIIIVGRLCYSQAEIVLPPSYSIIRYKNYSLPGGTGPVNLVVAYKNAKEEYTILGKTSSAVEEVKLFWEDHGSLIYLGKIDKSGIQKANGERLYDFGPSSGYGWRILGLDVSVLSNPLEPILVILDGDKIRESDVMYILTIDIKSKTLMYYDYSEPDENN
jgi:hypothetical protein